VAASPQRFTNAAPLIVPVETQVRELDAKLLLACVAAERGFPVVLGSRTFLHVGATGLPRGVYLAKSMRRKSARMFSIFQDLGHGIVAWDEEGLVRCPDPQYLGRNLSPETLRRTSLLLAWGPDHERVLRMHPDARGLAIRATGNARIDLVRPELRSYFDAEVEALRERFGPFLLLNTNFGRLNHFYPDLSEMRTDLDRDAEDFDATRARHRHALLEHFLQVVPFIADEFPDHRLVVRPHPSENPGTWRRAAAGRSNVSVINEGSVLPWLMAARALIHNGCTTSIEAFLLGTPIVTYRPVICESFDDPLPVALSHEAVDREGLAKSLRAAVNGELEGRDPARRAELDRHLVGIEGELACDRIVDALVDHGYAQGPPPPTSLDRRASARLRCQYRALSKRISMIRPGHRNHRDYLRHRFPPVPVEALQARIDRFAGVLGRFQDLRVRRRSHHVFEIGR